MSPPDDAPPLARLARWSEWWFTPRWRALLTWLALTGIISAVQQANWQQLFDLTQQPIKYLNGILPVRLPTALDGVPYILTFWLFLIWFQPLALRLSLRRGLAWISLSLGAEILWCFYDTSDLYHSNWTWGAIQCGSAALQCGVLCGWRSRPWMCLPAWTATSVLMISILPLLHVSSWYWLDVTVTALPNAVLLLYGTRLLRPEERAPGTTAK